MKLKDVIEFDKNKGQFVVASSLGVDKVNRLLREIAYNAQSGHDIQQAHMALAANIVEPIRQSVPYVEMYNMFFNTQPYDDLEDNSIPIEDIPTVAWETDRDGEVMTVRASYRWTRPSFTTFDVGIEVHWDDLRKAGWNYLARQMEYATEHLARKRDEKAKAIIDAAIPSGHAHTVSGGILTRASVKEVLKAAQQIGFPMTQCLVNAGTVTDMAEWTFPQGQKLDINQSGLLTNLYLGTYGGCQFFANPHAPVSKLYFSGPPQNVGIHQERGDFKTASDVDIRKKLDIHVFYDKDHAWYIGNPYNMRSLTITS